MTPKYAITAARLEDLARLAAIELAAARLLAGHAPEPVVSCGFRSTGRGETRFGAGLDMRRSL